MRAQSSHLTREFLASKPLPSLRSHYLRSTNSNQVKRVEKTNPCLIFLWGGDAVWNPFPMPVSEIPAHRTHFDRIRPDRADGFWLLLHTQSVENIERGGHRCRHRKPSFWKQAAMGCEGCRSLRGLSMWAQWPCDNSRRPSSDDARASSRPRRLRNLMALLRNGGLN